MFRTALFAFLALVVFTPGAFAKGLEVGKTIPAITAKDQNGKEQSFDSLKGEKGLTIVFVRSVEWCAFCQRQVMDLSENAKKFKDAGYPLVTISYDTVAKLTQFAGKFKTDLTLLSDPRSDIIKSFGIFNDNYAKGTMAFGTPFPGVYVVSADKTVKAKFFKEGVQDRPTVDELLASMKEEPAPMSPAEEFPQEETAPETTTPVMPEAQAPVAPEAPVEAPAATLEAPVVETPVVETAVEPVVPAPAAEMPPVPAPVETPVETPSSEVAPEEGAANEYMPPTEDDMPADGADGSEGQTQGGL